MKLLIRSKSQWITFLHNIEELRECILNYIPGRHITLGDISTFNSSMLQMLLKFCEDNPAVDLYSSKDITDPILYSRFQTVIKEPLHLDSKQDEKEYLASEHSYTSAVQNLGQLSAAEKLQVTHLDNQLTRLFL